MNRFKLLIKDYIRITIKQLKKFWPFLLFFGLYLILTWIFLDNNCLIKIVFGVPCPGCGMTRAFISLLKFDLPSAFYYHPLFLLVPLIAFMVVYNERPLVNKLYKSNLVWILLGVMFIGCFILRIIYVYPDAPMDLNPDSFIMRILRLFRK